MKKKIIITVIIVSLLIISVIFIVLLQKTENSNNPSELFDDMENLVAYPFEDFVSVLPSKTRVETRYIIDSFSSSSIYYKEYRDAFPSHLQKQLDSNHLLIIFRLKKDEKDIYAYVVFEDIKNDTSDNQTFDYWICYGEFYFSKTSAAISVFQNLVIGESITEIKANQMEISRYDLCLYQNNQGIWEIETFCLTDSGIIKVIFQVDDDIIFPATVKEIHFYNKADAFDETSGISLLIDYFAPKPLVD